VTQTIVLLAQLRYALGFAAGKSALLYVRAFSAPHCPFVGLALRAQRGQLRGIDAPTTTTQQRTDLRRPRSSDPPSLRCGASSLESCRRLAVAATSGLGKAVVLQDERVGHAFRPSLHSNLSEVGVSHRIGTCEAPKGISPPLVQCSATVATCYWVTVPPKAVMAVTIS